MWGNISQFSFSFLSAFTKIVFLYVFPFRHCIHPDLDICFLSQSVFLLKYWCPNIHSLHFHIIWISRVPFLEISQRKNDFWQQQKELPKSFLHIFGHCFYEQHICYPKYLPLFCFNCLNLEHGWVEKYTVDKVWQISVKMTFN